MYQFSISYFVPIIKSVAKWLIVLCLVATLFGGQTTVLPASTADQPDDKQRITAATVSGRVFFDNNRDGRQDDDEPGVPSVTVSYGGSFAAPPPVVNEDGSISAVGGGVFAGEATTDANGNYVFEGLSDGPDVTYDGISFHNLPDGYQFTLSNAGDDDTIDSDPDSSGNTPEFQLTAGEALANVDAGIVVVSGGRVSGRVFFDNNRNGLQDSDEPGVPNVTVFYSGSVVGRTETVNEDGSVSAVGGGTFAGETTTDENGDYLVEGFPNLSDPTFYYDVYGIRFSNLPVGYRFTSPDVGNNETIDSDANGAGSTPRFQLIPGEVKAAIDAGLVTDTSIGGRVFFDTNGNGLQDPGESGVPNVTVSYDGSVAGSTIITDANGNISAVGGPAFAGDTTTDADGNYQITGFAGGAEDTATYNIARIRFDGLPSGYRISESNMGEDDTVDSDPDTVGEIPGFQITAGEIKNNIDAGIVAVPLGDTNCDGLVNAVDGLFILQYEVGLRTVSFSCPLGRGGNQFYITRSDTNQDGVTTSVDALFILQCDIGRPNPFCPESPEIIDVPPPAQTLFVGPEQADCVGVAPQQCLLVRETPEEEYTFFFDTIEGFEWEAGFEYELLVNIEEIDNPPADASSLRYTLVEVVSKTPVVAVIGLDARTLLVAGNSDFAFDLYQKLSAEKSGNLLFSPYSVSSLLAMIYAGARGETESQMAETLRHMLSQELLHPAFKELDLALQPPPSEEAENGEDEAAFQLSIVNGLWKQLDFELLADYLNTIAENYRLEIESANFVDPEQREAARLAINAWVENATENRIVDFLAEGVLTADTRLALINAIYFNAQWEKPFLRGTSDANFTLLDGSQVSVPTMSRRWSTKYAQLGEYEILEIPYKGQSMSMVIYMPSQGSFTNIEQSLTRVSVNQDLESLKTEDVALYLPKFEYETDLTLKQTMQDMGMVDLFTPNQADLSGMDGTQNLFLAHLIHKSFIAVDELGTEAAAATGGLLEVVSVPIDVRINRPFIYLIRDSDTGTILFMGRVLDPSG